MPQKCTLDDEIHKITNAALVVEASARLLAKRGAPIEITRELEQQGMKLCKAAGQLLVKPKFPAQKERKPGHNRCDGTAFFEPP